ncbi:MAG TPA: virulence factor [Anaerolineae bacterium]|nr:virulence factor [Anaerolineae bacterium]
MAEYRVIYWKHIPTLVIAKDGEGPQVRCPLPPRFQAMVDAVAMAEGSISDEDYSAGWRKSEWQTREGKPDQVAKEVAVELEAAFDGKDKFFQ